MISSKDLIVPPCKYANAVETSSVGLGLLTPDDLCGICSRVVDSPSHLMFLVADSGLGKSYALDCFARLARQNGAFVDQVSFCDCDSREVPSRMGRYARSIASSAGSGERFILIDGMPAADEFDADREANALARLSGQGFSVIVALRPEEATLVDSCHGYAIVRSRDLICPIEGDGKYLWLANGVPALASSFVGVSEHASRGNVLPTYVEALRACVTSAVRDSLTDEEKRVRLAMILIGRGDFDDLSDVCRFDDDMAASLEADAPFFGANLLARTFSVAGVCDDTLFSAALPGLYGCLDSSEVVIQSAACTLARLGEYGRCAIVAGLSHDGAFLKELSCDFGVDFINAGALALVDAHLPQQSEIEWADTVLARRSWAFWAARSLEGEQGDLPKVLGLPGDAPLTFEEGTLPEPLGGHGEGSENGLAACSGGGSGDGLESNHYYEQRLPYISPSDDVNQQMKACLLCLSRKALAGMVTRYSPDPRYGCQDEFALRLVEHLNACRALIDGHFSDVYESLINSEACVHVNDLTSLFIHDDFRIASLLLGERGSRDDELGRESLKRVVSSTGSKLLEAYRDYFNEALRTVMGFDAVFRNAERAISRASAHGDRVAEIVFLLAAAVGDVRLGSCKRGYVRARQAIKRADACGCTYLRDAATLITYAAEAKLGEELSYRPGEIENGALGDLARMLYKACVGDDSRVRLDSLSRSGVSHEVSWALWFLCNDLGDASECFRGLIPANWRRVSGRAVPGVEECDDDSGSLTPTVPPAGEADAKAKRVQVKVLGSFEVRVDGRLVPFSRINKRRAKDVLALLALTPGHKMRKVELLRCIWGEDDYATGAQKLYEAIASLRSALGGRYMGFDPVHSSRHGGYVTVGEGDVEFDVDRFNEICQRVLAGGCDDEARARKAVVVHQMYEGGPAYVASDVTGNAARKIERIDRLYASSCVEGAQCALRSGRYYLAAELSRAVFDKWPSREDALLVLLGSLKGLGLRSEALYAFRKHKTTLYSELGIRPSLEILSMVEEIVGEGQPDRSDEGVSAQEEREMEEGIACDPSPSSNGPCDTADEPTDMARDEGEPRERTDAAGSHGFGASLGGRGTSDIGERGIAS